MKKLVLKSQTRFFGDMSIRIERFRKKLDKIIVIDVRWDKLQHRVRTKLDTVWEILIHGTFR